MKNINKKRLKNTSIAIMTGADDPGGRVSAIGVTITRGAST